MKKQNSKIEIKFIMFIFALLIIIFLYYKFHDDSFHYLDHINETLVTVDGNDIPLHDLGFYIIYEETLGQSMATSYDETDTESFWHKHTNGEFMSSMARDSAISMAIHDEIFYQMALEHNITLSEEEINTAETRLQDYLNAITPSQLETLNLTEDDLRLTINKIATAEKYMLQYAQESGHYYEEYNFNGDAYQTLLEEHTIEKNSYLINKLTLGKLSISENDSEIETISESPSL